MEKVETKQNLNAEMPVSEILHSEDTLANALLSNGGPYFHFSEKSFSELQNEIVVLRDLLMRQKNLLNSLKNEDMAK